MPVFERLPVPIPSIPAKATMKNIIEDPTVTPQASDMVNQLYRHDCAGIDCESRWSEFALLEDEKEDLKRRTSEIPIIHRLRYDKKQWITHSFTVQSPVLRKVLTEALKGYQDLDMDLEDWTFQPPFQPLVHRWDQLKNLQADPTQSVEKTEIDALVAFLAPILAPSVEALVETRLTKKISFEAIWQIFPPGELVVAKFHGVDTVCRTLRYHLAQNVRGPEWDIIMEYVDWDGEACGYATARTTIEFFKGFRRLNSLPAYPLSYEPDSDGLKLKFIERGRKFERYRGYHFLAATGRRILLNRFEERPVSGRVVIDAFAYYTSCNIVKPSLRPLFEEETNIPGVEEMGLNNTVSLDNPPDALALHEPWPPGPVPPSPMPPPPGFSHPPPPPPSHPKKVKSSRSKMLPEVTYDTPIPQMASSTPAQPGSRNEDLRKLTDEQCLLAVPWLKGLDLKTKEWSYFFVDSLEEISWNDAAFENLVLPGGEKELAWAFVESKTMSDFTFDDFVTDKGRGVIILMFGPPGVGKTYTAEAVAERSRVPLYTVSAGVLGTKPEEVEKALDHALELCRLWSAMLLLDEADVFLAARTHQSFARNELVSIFLTKLEYYRGILFLTTNRSSSIDPAFQSRVDLFLPYSDLTPQVRKDIWLNFINFFGTDMFEVTDDGLEKLSKVSLNGREIKNLIKSARLLSLRRGGKVSTEQLNMLADKRVKALKSLMELP